MRSPLKSGKNSERHLESRLFLDVEIICRPIVVVELFAQYPRRKPVKDFTSLVTREIMTSAYLKMFGYFLKRPCMLKNYGEMFTTLL